MIKIIKSKTELSEDRLNQLEAQGLTLISANCAVTSEYAEWGGIGMSFKHDVTRWTYHFRSAAEKIHGDRGRTGTFF